MALIILNNTASNVSKIKRSKDLLKERKRMKTALYISLLCNLIQYLFF